MTAIPGPDQVPSIEVVRGRLDQTGANQLLAFWSDRRALSDQEARRRLAEVVCVLRTEGTIVGASSVFPAELPLIGGRPFWIYRSLLDRAFADQAPAMIRGTFEVLDAEFDGSADAPVGLCVLADEEQRRRRPQAEWHDPHMIYAGYLRDGHQVRLAYFSGALIA